LKKAAFFYICPWKEDKLLKAPNYHETKRKLEEAIAKKECTLEDILGLS
jgi:hypothetical protein